MGRHALVDLSTIFRTPPKPTANRLSKEVVLQLRGQIFGANTALRPELLSEDRLNELREMYEPYANALGEHFLMALPPWIPGTQAHDYWQTTSWEHMASRFAVSDPFLAEVVQDKD
jgi:hypothetical protein